MENNLLRSNQEFSQEPEINLIDYWHIIWNRRRAIFAIFISVVILTIIITFLSPKTYQSSLLISPAKISNQLLETPEATITIMKQEAILRNLATKLNLPELEATSLIKKFNIKQSNEFLEIQGLGTTPENAQHISKILGDFIINRQNSLTTQYKLNLETEINVLNNELNKNAATIVELEQEIAKLNNTNSQAQGYIAASYISVRQEAKKRRDEIQNSLNEKLRELNFKTYEAKIEVPPVLPLSPIKPDKFINLISGTILGIFVGIIYAFTAEAIQKNKKVV